MYYLVPEFRVDWKLLKLSNMGAKVSKYRSDVMYLAKLFSGTCSCLEFSTTSNSHAARENLRRLVALWNQLRSCLCGENISWEEGSLAFPSYLRRANFSFIILQTIGDSLHEKQKVSGSARRVTHQTAFTFFDGRVTLLPSQNFYA